MKSFQAMSSLLFLLALIPCVMCAKKSIFILAGQSNMAGRGGVWLNQATPNPYDQIWDHVIPPECQSNPSIIRLNANLKWEVAKEPLHADIEDAAKVCGIGPGMSFAHELLRKNHAGPIALVPCAKGGTSMADWSRGGTLYNNMMERVAAALKHGGNIQALLWYQGEQEALLSLGSFAKDVPTFFKAVRHDLNLSRLPIVQVALPPTVKGNFTKEVREIQLKINLPFLATVDANGSDLEGDMVHLTTPAQVKIGQKMATAFLELMHN